MIQSSNRVCGDRFVSSSLLLFCLVSFLSRAPSLSLPLPLRFSPRGRYGARAKDDAPPAAPLLAALPRRGRLQAQAAPEGAPASESARRARGRGGGAALARDEPGADGGKVSPLGLLLRSSLFFSRCSRRRAPPSIECSASELRGGRRGVFPEGLRVAKRARKGGRGGGKQQRRRRRRRQQRERFLSFQPAPSPGVFPRRD